MYCPKCGANNPEKQIKCENCGFLFVKEEPMKKAEKPKEEQGTSEPVFSKEIVGNTTNIQSKQGEPVFKQKENHQKKTFAENGRAIFLFGAAALVLVLCIWGAISIFFGGALIGSIQSVGGKTLEEAYYRELRYIYNGMGIVCIAFGIFCSSVLSYLGTCVLRNAKETE